MAKTHGVSDETLVRSLGLYVGMVDKVLTDPERWLGVDDDEDAAAAGIPRRALEAVLDRARGEVTPASDNWDQQPQQERVSWWVSRIAVGAGLAAAAPRFAGALADRLPLQAALGASASGLAVCAVAREHGVVAPGDWVPLLAKVLFERDLDPVSTPAPVPADEQSEHTLLEPDPDSGPAEPAEPAQPAGSAGTPSGEAAQDRSPGLARSVGRGVQNSARTLWRLATAFRDINHLLDERPRGNIFARSLAKVPVVGVAGGWLDERGAIQKAAKETAELLA